MAITLKHDGFYFKNAILKILIIETYNLLTYKLKVGKTNKTNSKVICVCIDGNHVLMATYY